ncbi:CapA family protein [Anaerorhabdus furcosa]|uniref:Poly-gamma-glutamate synthesis protein (Capsule biosynthesis protein) n=1 Tax=Anaerorhabdus furcosa TaxID=118967 RepID=A0A1T4JWF0_9FIRM|nr:CapA family protein [Anaerorhabdus furcosa]SJZ34478.1 poly-gamma-glutamate synthesis protein (capsule biosynthesis protein) [Anaerorhabdus furcosa]
MKNKKLEKEIVALVLTIVFCIIAVSVVLLILINTFNEKQKEEIIEKTKPPVVSNYSASIFFGGKVSVDDDLISEYTVDGVQDFYPLIENIEPAVSNNEVALFQLDDVVVNDYKEEGVPKSFADMFSSIGFSMVSLASADQLELGETQLLDSHTYWDNQIMYTSGSEAHEQGTTAIYDKNGITFGLLSYTMPQNIEGITITNPFLLDVYNDQKAASDIMNLRNQVDIIIVYLDWGEVDSFEVTNEQHRIAKLLADSGADVLLGTGTGSIQPIEWIDDTIVYYSLGNLLTTNTDLDERVGMIGSIFVQKTVVDGVVTIEKSQPKADLIYTTSNSTKIMMFDELTDELQNKESVYEKYSVVLTMLDDSIRIGGIK